MRGFGVRQKKKRRPSSSERWAGDRASLGKSKLESEPVNDRGDHHWEPGERDIVTYCDKDKLEIGLLGRSS